MKNEIIKNLPVDYPWKEQISFFGEIDSTNHYLKQLAMQGAKEGTAVLADCQTMGRGRRGRSFYSPPGKGVYLSLLLRPSCGPEQLMHLTCAVAVAICDAIERTAGFRPKIKWINDLVFEKRKLGGILTELGFLPDGSVDYVVIGVGLNCKQELSDFPEEIREIATSIAQAAQRPFTRAQLIAAMLDALWQMSRQLSCRETILQRYQSDCITLGQYVSVLRGESLRHGTALKIDGQGGLLVRYTDGEEEIVNSGEVSVRGMYHYI